MAESYEETTAAEQRLGDFAPKLASLTADVLFGDIWERPGPSIRDRSLPTAAALVASTAPSRCHSIYARHWRAIQIACH